MLGDVPELLPARGRFARRGLPLRRGRRRVRRVGRGRRRGRARGAGREARAPRRAARRGRGRRRRARSAASPRAVWSSKGRHVRRASARSRRGARAPGPGLPAASRAAAAGASTSTVTSGDGVRARGLDEPVGDAGRALRLAAGEVGRQLERAQPNKRPCSAARLDGSSERAGPFERLLGRPSSTSRPGQSASSVCATSVRPRCSQKAIPCSKSASERAGPSSG